MKTLGDDYKREVLLEGLVGRFRVGEKGGFEWSKKVVVEYGIHRKEDHVLKELRVGQEEVG